MFLLRVLFSELLFPKPRKLIEEIQDPERVRAEREAENQRKRKRNSDEMSDEDYQSDRVEFDNADSNEVVCSHRLLFA